LIAPTSDEPSSPISRFLSLSSTKTAKVSNKSNAPLYFPLPSSQNERSKASIDRAHAPGSVKSVLNVSCWFQSRFHPDSQRPLAIPCTPTIRPQSSRPFKSVRSVHNAVRNDALLQPLSSVSVSLLVTHIIARLPAFPLSTCPWSAVTVCCVVVLVCPGPLLMMLPVPFPCSPITSFPFPFLPPVSVWGCRADDDDMPLCFLFSVAGICQVPHQNERF